eukprot:TRINITY_DN42623_c0_g1_i1.p1 TRINITY_DN42623_c0_g1~~TRINITY_DN42623_c0_g1_i1.p1  ORF type:complete len:1236 (-),score=258.64 TRINITY_DN42623_c0_g1_i1:133-3723(-)
MAPALEGGLWTLASATARGSLCVAFGIWGQSAFGCREVLRLRLSLEKADWKADEVTRRKDDALQASRAHVEDLEGQLRQLESEVSDGGWESASTRRDTGGGSIEIRRSNVGVGAGGDGDGLGGEHPSTYRGCRGDGAASRLKSSEIARMVSVEIGEELARENEELMAKVDMVESRMQRLLGETEEEQEYHERSVSQAKEQLDRQEKQVAAEVRRAKLMYGFHAISRMYSERKMSKWDAETRDMSEWIVYFEQENEYLNSKAEHFEEAADEYRDDYAIAETELGQAHQNFEYGQHVTQVLRGELHPLHGQCEDYEMCAVEHRSEIASLRRELAEANEDGQLLAERERRLKQELVSQVDQTASVEVKWKSAVERKTLQEEEEEVDEEEDETWNTRRKISTGCEHHKSSIQARDQDSARFAAIEMSEELERDNEEIVTALRKVEADNRRLMAEYVESTSEELEVNSSLRGELADALERERCLKKPTFRHITSMALKQQRLRRGSSFEKSWIETDDEGEDNSCMSQKQQGRRGRFASDVDEERAVRVREVGLSRLAAIGMIKQLERDNGELSTLLERVKAENRGLVAEIGEMREQHYNASGAGQCQAENREGVILKALSRSKMQIAVDGFCEARAYHEINECHAEYQELFDWSSYFEQESHYLAAEVSVLEQSIDRYEARENLKKHSTVSELLNRGVEPLQSCLKDQEDSASVEELECDNSELSALLRRTELENRKLVTEMMEAQHLQESGSGGSVSRAEPAFRATSQTLSSRSIQTAAQAFQDLNGSRDTDKCDEDHKELFEMTSFFEHESAYLTSEVSALNGKMEEYQRKFEDAEVKLGEACQELTEALLREDKGVAAEERCKNARLRGELAEAEELGGALVERDLRLKEELKQQVHSMAHMESEQKVSEELERKSDELLAQFREESRENRRLLVEQEQLLEHSVLQQTDAIGGAEARKEYLNPHEASEAESDDEEGVESSQQETRSSSSSSWHHNPKSPKQEIKLARLAATEICEALDQEHDELAAMLWEVESVKYKLIAERREKQEVHGEVDSVKCKPITAERRETQEVLEKSLPDGRNSLASTGGVAVMDTFQNSPEAAPSLAKFGRLHPRGGGSLDQRVLWRMRHRALAQQQDLARFRTTVGDAEGDRQAWRPPQANPPGFGAAMSANSRVGDGHADQIGRIGRSTLSLEDFLK